MKHLELLGTNLKSDALNELLETYDVDVVYRYDRTHEGIPDAYVAKVSELGLELVFDAQQMLRTMFLMNAPIAGFNPFESDDGVPKFASKSEALKYADTQKVRVSEGHANFLGEERDWVRLEYPMHTIHYEFVSSRLRMTTIQVVQKANAAGDIQ